MEPGAGAGGHTTILSIDGGGTRGIIEGVTVEFLESKLQVKISKLKLYFEQHISFIKMSESSLQFC